MSLIIQSGDPVCVLGKGMLSEAIAKLTGPISHVGVITARLCPDAGCSNYEHYDVTQALGGGIVTLSLAATMTVAKYGYVCHDSALTDAEREMMAAYALKQVGIKYATANLFWELADILTADEKWSIYMDDDNREICSQFAALDRLSVGKNYGVSPRKCTPTDIFHYSLATPGWLTQPLNA